MKDPIERPSGASAAIDAVAALGDGPRRRMFEFVRRARRPVSREEAAADAGISRKLAAFHLDKLVRAGLLRASYAAPAGVGRAPKVYEPTEADIRVSIPARHHDALATILLDAVESAESGETPRQAALRVARAQGRALGEAVRKRRRPGRLGTERALSLAREVLEERGFEPVRGSSELLTLANCPFHPLTAHNPELVCGLNHAHLAALLEGLGADTVEAVLEPAPGSCCVKMRAATP